MAVADGPGKVLANGMADVEHYLRAEGLTRDEIEQSLDLAAETDSYVIVGTRPDALYFEYGDYRIEEGGGYLEEHGDWDER
jgi:hypothetical protein